MPQSGRLSCPERGPGLPWPRGGHAGVTFSPAAVSRHPRLRTPARPWALECGVSGVGSEAAPEPRCVVCEQGEPLRARQRACVRAPADEALVLNHACRALQQRQGRVRQTRRWGK